MFKKKEWTRWHDVGIKQTILSSDYRLIQVREEINTGEKQFKSRVIVRGAYDLSGVTIPKTLIT